jgi:hypothetical protein
MHGSFDNSGKNEESIQQRWGMGFLALPVVLVITLIVLALTQPVASNWISEATQAELGVPGIAHQVAPTQLARPAMELPSIKTY